MMNISHKSCLGLQEKKCLLNIFFKCDIGQKVFSLIISIPTERKQAMY